MTTATQAEVQVSGVGGQVSGKPKRLAAHLLRGLHAEWRKLSPQLESELPERELRLAWTNEKLGVRYQVSGVGENLTPGTRHLKPITSWSDLSQGEARRLLKIMREESGDGPAYRAQIIARLAVRLWGSGSGVRSWEEPLRERLRQRFLTPDTRNLTPAQAHEMIEELLSRIARAEGREIEELRREIRKQNSEVRSQNGTR